MVRFECPIREIPLFAAEGAPNGSVRTMTSFQWTVSLITARIAHMVCGVGGTLSNSLIDVQVPDETVKLVLVEMTVFYLVLLKAGACAVRLPTYWTCNEDCNGPGQPERPESRRSCLCISQISVVQLEEDEESRICNLLLAFHKEHRSDLCVTGRALEQAKKMSIHGIDGWYKATRKLACSVLQQRSRG